MSEAEKLANARRTYDRSGVSSPVSLGNVVSLDVFQRYDDAMPTDKDQISAARRLLWSRLPKVHRVAKAELERRVSNASLLAHSRAWTWGSPCLVSCGPTAVGKSSAAALVVLRLMSRGLESDWRRWKGIRWFGASQLVNAAREWALGDSECPDIRAASNCELLILDDLGNEQDWQSTMFDLLHARYERGLSNIVTTGLRRDGLMKRYGEAILRRMLERDGKMGTIVDCW